MMFDTIVELEADNRGITEILEKHSLEMDAAPQLTNLKENRFPKKTKRSSLGMPTSFSKLEKRSHSTAFPLDLLGGMEASRKLIYSLFYLFW